MDVPRRELLLSALCTLVASPLFGCKPVRPASPRWNQRITESIAVVGRRYLADHPDERNRQRLAELLGVDSARDVAEMTRALHERMNRDVYEANFVTVEHWLLPRSEARFYALISLHG